MVYSDFNLDLEMPWINDDIDSIFKMESFLFKINKIILEIDSIKL